MSFYSLYNGFTSFAIKCYAAGYSFVVIGFFFNLKITNVYFTHLQIFFQIIHNTEILPKVNNIFIATCCHCDASFNPNIM